MQQKISGREVRTIDIKKAPVEIRVLAHAKEAYQAIMKEKKMKQEEKLTKDEMQENICKGMYKVTMLLMEKTAERMKKETKMSRKTLKMASLAERLFTTFRTWGR